MAAPATYVDQAGRQFVQSLNEFGLDETSESAEDLGRRAALAVAAESVWEDTLGPLLTSAEARALLGGISREALSKKVKVGTVLRLKDDRGLTRYPAWQFDPVAQTAFSTIETLISIYRKAGVGDRMVASFCATPQPELDDRQPAELLKKGESPELITAATRAVVALTD